eukprot:1277419-Rhodomonas_salina.2
MLAYYGISCANILRYFLCYPSSCPMRPSHAVIVCCIIQASAGILVDLSYRPKLRAYAMPGTEAVRTAVPGGTAAHNRGGRPVPGAVHARRRRRTEVPRPPPRTNDQYHLFPTRLRQRLHCVQCCSSCAVHLSEQYSAFVRGAR